MSCTIPEEALCFFVRTLVPDMIEFSNQKKVRANMKNG